jgi:DNA-binding MltR family transcriptional regulator
MASHKDPSDHLKGLNFDVLSSIIFDSPDWPTCLMAITFLEQILEISLNVKFDGKLTKTERAELFSGHGPLSTLSSKISIGYALGLFSKEAKVDLNKLKSIRNEAAHRINDFSFSLEKISRICSQLQLVDALTPGQLDMIPIGRVKWEKLGFDSPRAKFTLSLCHVMTQILLNARIHTLFIRPNKIKNESLLKALLPAVGFEYPSFRRIEPANKHAALATAIRRAIEENRLPHSPHLDKLRLALSMVEKAAVAKANP